MRPNYETRFLPGIAEEEGKLVGYAAVFDQLSNDLGGVREMLDRRAFDWTLEANPDVRALIDHDSGRVLGRTKAGTLTLEADDHGLRAIIDPPDTQYARDLLESVRRGDISGMSFAFRVPDKKRDQRLEFRGDDVPIRHLLRVELREVSVVTFPAFDQTSVSVRSLVEECDPLAFYRMRLRLAED